MQFLRTVTALLCSCFAVSNDSLLAGCTAIWQSHVRIFGRLLLEGARIWCVSAESKNALFSNSPTPRKAAQSTSSTSISQTYLTFTTTISSSPSSSRANRPLIDSVTWSLPSLLKVAANRRSTHRSRRRTHLPAPSLRIHSIFHRELERSAGRFPYDCIGAPARQITVDIGNRIHSRSDPQPVLPQLGTLTGSTRPWLVLRSRPSFSHSFVVRL